MVPAVPRTQDERQYVRPPTTGIGAAVKIRPPPVSSESPMERRVAAQVPAASFCHVTGPPLAVIQREVPPSQSSEKATVEVFVVAPRRAMVN